MSDPIIPPWQGPGLYSVTANMAGHDPLFTEMHPVNLDEYEAGKTIMLADLAENITAIQVGGLPVPQYESQFRTPPPPKPWEV